MTYTKTFKNASVVSINQGTITIQTHCEGQLTLQSASLVSLLDGNITLNIEYPDFKRGDILFNTVHNTVFIFKEILNDDVFDLGYTSPFLTCITSIAPWDIDYLQNVRYATGEEKQRLFTEVYKKYKKSWNAQTLTWEKTIWEPKIGDIYWCIDKNYITSEFTVITAKRVKGIHEERMVQGNYFQTKEEAEEAMAQIKEVLASYHK